VFFQPALLNGKMNLRHPQIDSPSNNSLGIAAQLIATNWPSENCSFDEDGARGFFWTNHSLSGARFTNNQYRLGDEAYRSVRSIKSLMILMGRPEGLRWFQICFLGMQGYWCLRVKLINTQTDWFSHLKWYLYEPPVSF